eukprot:88004-Amphidinium_carterae.1
MSTGGSASVGNHTHKTLNMTTPDKRAASSCVEEISLPMRSEQPPLMIDKVMTTQMWKTTRLAVVPLMKRRKPVMGAAVL